MRDADGKLLRRAARPPCSACNQAGRLAHGATNAPGQGRMSLQHAVHAALACALPRGGPLHLCCPGTARVFLPHTPLIPLHACPDAIWFLHFIPGQLPVSISFARQCMYALPGVSDEFTWFLPVVAAKHCTVALRHGPSMSGLPCVFPLDPHDAHLFPPPGCIKPGACRASLPCNLSVLSSLTQAAVRSIPVLLCRDPGMTATLPGLRMFMNRH